jgi:hypothetical protein
LSSVFKVENNWKLSRSQEMWIGIKTCSMLKVGNFLLMDIEDFEQNT